MRPMLTLDRSQEPPVLRERRAFGPLALGGMLFAGLALVPLTADAPWGALRGLAFAGLVAIAAGLVALGSPRSRVRELPRRGAGASADERPVALELTSVELPATYRAELVLAQGGRRTVLERPDPAGVLSDAAELARLLDLPLVPGWGMDDHQLQALLHPPASAGARSLVDGSLTFESLALAGQRHAAFATLWASAFVLSATFIMSESARALVTPSGLSIVLPIVSAVFVLVAGLWLLGLRGRVVLGPTGVAHRRSWFGWQLGRPQSLEAAVRAAAIVGSTNGTLAHLVVVTEQGLRAFPVRGGMPQIELLANAMRPPLTTRAAE
jgi:hypothetical protein